MITMDNYDGWLMRYADGELGNSEHAEVESFLQKHPELQEELKEVCSVKVTAPMATLPGKEKLLHKEGFAFSPAWRAAAAVALLLIAGGATMLLTNHSEDKPLVAKVEKSRQGQQDLAADVKPRYDGDKITEPCRGGTTLIASESPLQSPKQSPSPTRELTPTANNCRPLAGTSESHQEQQDLAADMSPRYDGAIIAESHKDDASIFASPTLPHLRGGVLVVETTGLVSYDSQLASSESSLQKIQEFFMRPE